MITVENESDRLSVELPSQAIFESGGITILSTNLYGAFIRRRTDNVTEGDYPVEYTSNYEVYRFSSNSGLWEFKSGGSITIKSIDRNKRTVSGKYSVSRYEAA